MRLVERLACCAADCRRTHWIKYDVPTLVNARYERGSMILTSNRGFAEWGEVFGDNVVATATALLDRLLHHAVVIQIEGASYRLRQHADLIPDTRLRTHTPPPQTVKRRGRPPKHRSQDHQRG
jgi:hypothetical protein